MFDSVNQSEKRMEIRYSAKDAARLVGHCRNVEDARYLIENSAVIGAIDGLLTRGGGFGADPAAIHAELARKGPPSVSLAEVEHALDWLAAVGRLRARPSSAGGD